MASKQKHWTQTLRGKRILRANAKKTAAILKEAKTNGKAIIGTPRSGTPEVSEFHSAYLYGRLERDIETYCLSNGISFAAVAGGVAELLQRKARR